MAKKKFHKVESMATTTTTTSITTVNMIFVFAFRLGVVKKTEKYMR